MNRSQPGDSGTRGRRASLAADEAYLEKAIDRYAPGIAATARAALEKLGVRFPGARRLVYERRGSLPIGFAAPHGSPIFSVVLYPRWVRFFFLEGVALDDPDGRLEGSGNQVRSVRLDQHAAVLDDPYIRGLMAQAVKAAGAELTTGRGSLVIKSKIVTAKRPPST
jgi:hypothetical protein